MCDVTTEIPLDNETRTALLLFNERLDARALMQRGKKRVAKAERAREAAAADVRKLNGNPNATAEEKAEAEATYKAAVDEYNVIAADPTAGLDKPKPKKAKGDSEEASSDEAAASESEAPEAEATEADTEEPAPEAEATEAEAPEAEATEAEATEAPAEEPAPEASNEDTEEPSDDAAAAAAAAAPLAEVSADEEAAPAASSDESE